MALRPVDFNVPQRRPSPIEQAFTVALSTAAGELISAPFDKRKEARRAAQELEQMKLQADIQLKQAKQLGDIQFGRHIQENYTPYTIGHGQLLQGMGVETPEILTLQFNGQRYLPNATIARITEGARPVSEPTRDLFSTLQSSGLKIGTPRTQLELSEVTPLVGEAVQAMAVNEAAAGRRLNRQKDLMNVMAGLFANPNIQAFSGAHTARTRRALRPEEMRALATQGTAAGIAADPSAYPEARKIAQRYLDIVNNLETEEGGVVFPRTVSVKVEDIVSNANRMRTPEGTEEAMGYAGALLNFPVKLLRGTDGRPVPNDGTIATQALKNNSMLSIAVYAADVYGSADRVLQAERAGLGELPARAKAYMQYIFYMRGMPWDLGEPMLGLPQEGYPDLRNLPGQGRQQQQADTTGSFSTSGRTGGAVPTGQQALTQAIRQGGAVKGPVGPQVNAGPLSGAYQWFHGALASDSSSYPKILDKLDTIFSGTPDQIADALEQYEFPKAVADSVRRFPTQANRHRRSLEAALQQARIDLLNSQE